MNANCLSCFATVPYENGQRPNFCPKCGKSMSLGSNPTKPTFRAARSEDEDEQGLTPDDVKNLSIAVTIVGGPENNIITLGQLATDNSSFGGPAPSRPNYQGNALEDLTREMIRPTKIDEE